jgi:hypothetical protein
LPSKDSNLAIFVSVNFEFFPIHQSTAWHISFAAQLDFLVVFLFQILSLL